MKFEKPATPFVFDFLGQANRFEGEHASGIIRIGNDRIELPTTVQAPQGKLLLPVRMSYIFMRNHRQIQLKQLLYVKSGLLEK